jgi:hypothetical protein
MITPIVTLLVGAIIAALVVYGLFKKIFACFVIAALLALGFLGYMFFWAKPPQPSSPSIFRGPIIIKIQPSKGAMSIDPKIELAPETREKLSEFLQIPQGSK